MKTQGIKLTKNDAVTIAYRALAETIVQKPGIWTHLNQHVRVSQGETTKQRVLAKCA